MATNPDSELRQILDKLWRNKNKDTVASELINIASDDALLILAAFDFVVEAGVSATKIDAKCSPKKVTLQYSSPINGMAEISIYAEDGLHLWRKPLTRLPPLHLKSQIDLGTSEDLNLEQLFQLTQYARDYADSVIMLPGEQRKRRIEILQKDFKFPINQIQNALVHAHPFTNLL